MSFRDWLFQGCQLTTTVRIVEVEAPSALVLIRKRLPSAVASYWNRASLTTRESGASKRGWGAPGSKDDLGADALLTGAAIILRSAATKKSSLPSPRQRGCSPPAAEIFHIPSAGANGQTQTPRGPNPY